MSKVAVDLRGVPEPIRVAVDAEARERNASLADVVGSAIGAALGTKYESSGYPYTGSGESGHWNVRVDPEMLRMLRYRANTLGGNVTGLVYNILSIRYGLDEHPVAGRARARLTPAEKKKAVRRHAKGESVSSLAKAFGVKWDTMNRIIQEGK